MVKLNVLFYDRKQLRMFSQSRKTDRDNPMFPVITD